MQFDSAGELTEMASNVTDGLSRGRWNLACEDASSVEFFLKQIPIEILTKHDTIILRKMYYTPINQKLKICI